MPTPEVDPPRGQPPARSRISIGGMMLAVAIVGLGLAPLASLSDGWLVALVYLRVGGLVAATFLARFGPARWSGWWFGFATLGWAGLIIREESLWYPTNGHPLELLGVDVAAPIEWAGDLLANLMDPGLTEGNQRFVVANQRFAIAVTSVVSFWSTLISATIGGFLGLALDRRREARTQSPG